MDQKDKDSQHNHSDGGIIDLEEHYTTGKPVPHGKQYRIRIDKQHYIVDVPEMKGREILALAGKTPDKFLLRQKTKSGVEEIGSEQLVSFVHHGIERFMTIPNEVQEGEAMPPRLHFDPLATDMEFLNSLGLRWEAVVEGAVKTYVIYNWPIPDGYNVTLADVHVRLNNGYPDTQIDMAYFCPPLARKDSRHVGGLTVLQFDGREWQQWSRHRTQNSMWRIGEDDLSTHMALVSDWLRVEMSK